MLVDDEPALLTVGKAILTSLGAQVIAAGSGEAAVELLSQDVVAGIAPGVVLLDLTMPGGMSGLDTLDKLLQIVPDLPVIACSGFFGDGAEEVCQKLGFAGMLSKPYTPEALIAIVRRTCLLSSE
jgi:CheY-like chemotaxis protein